MIYQDILDPQNALVMVFLNSHKIRYMNKYLLTDDMLISFRQIYSFQGLNVQYGPLPPFFRCYLTQKTWKHNISKCVALNFVAEMFSVCFFWGRDEGLSLIGKFPWFSPRSNWSCHDSLSLFVSWECNTLKIFGIVDSPKGYPLKGHRKFILVFTSFKSKEFANY